MAIFFDNAANGLEHTTDVLPLDGDWSIMLWVQPLVDNPTGGAYRTYWALADTTFTNYVEIASDADAGTIDMYGYDGTNFTSKFDWDATGLLGTAYHVCITYDLSATTIKYYINGFLVYTYALADFSGITSTDEFLFYDGTSTHSNMAIQNARAWDAVLTAAEILVEIPSNTAVKTANLYYDTPLTNASDLADVSANARNWANIATAGTDYTTYDVKFPSPTNTAATTALTVPYLPYKVAQSNRLSPTTYTNLWYSYTATAADNNMSVWGYSPTTDVDDPQIRIFTGPASSPVQYLSGILGSRKQVQFPVTGATTYYIRERAIVNQTGQGAVIVQFSSSGTPDVTSGDIIVPSDGDGLSAAIVREGFGVISFNKDIPNGEQGDVLETGEIAQANRYSPKNIKTFDIDLVEMSDISSLNSDYNKFIRTNNGLDIFYVVASNYTPVQDSEVYTIDATGTLSSLIATLPSVSLGAELIYGGATANNAGTILYYTDRVGGYNVKRWDLSGNAPLSDFLAAVANYNIVDLLTLDNDNIVVSYFDESIGGHDFYVKIYNPAGALQNTYNFGDTNFADPARLAYSTNNSTSFWVWLHKDGDLDDGIAHFKEIQISDGATLTDVPVLEMDSDGTSNITTPTPYGIFGVSPSCPFYILREGFIPPPPINPSSGIYKVVPRSRKSNDTLYVSFDPLETEVVKIPDPYVKLGPIGK